MPGEVINPTMTKRTHSSHPKHELKLKNYQKPYRCDGCKEHGYGPRYRCDLCDFDLHKECMLTSPTTSHEFFQEDTFTFFNQPPRKCRKRNCSKCRRYCDACGQAVKGFVYHCEEKGWDLHPCCRKLKKKISIDCEEFLLREKVSQKCMWCMKRKLPNSVAGIPGWSYVSKSDNRHFHVHCITQMVLESWTNGPNDNNRLALETLELPLQAKSFGRKGKRSTFLRIAKMLLASILSILLGDPTTTLVSVFLELVPK